MQSQNDGAIAQLVEQRTENPCVPGSIPGGTTQKSLAEMQGFFGFNMKIMKKFLFTLLALFFSTITFAQKEHFGLILGSHYNVEQIGKDCKIYYGNNAGCGGSGNFYQIRIYSNCSKEGATFGHCTIDFYKGRLWKVTYENIQNDPNEFAKKLERRYYDYSVSETKFEYQYGNISFDFDGDRLRYVDESVSRSMLGW